jgi:soluble lytic murein transglycosylase-like protein
VAQAAAPIFEETKNFMTRLTVAAAALVAGMTAFAANAQEAPALASAVADMVAAKTAKAGTAIATRTGRGSALVAVAGEETPAPAKGEPKPKPGKIAETEVSKKASKAAGDVAAVAKKPAAAEVYEQGMVPALVAGPVAKQPVKGGAVASATQEQGMAFVAEIDQTKTASVGKRKRPELIAVARKGVTGDAGEIVAEAKSGGKSGGGKYGALISRYAASYGVPVALAHAVIRVESNYRANARGKAGEIGLMQIKPATARAMGYSGGTAGLYNPETNIRFGMKYLAMAHQLGGGSTCGTILKYNAGHGARRMNPVSAAYCRKVQRHLGS